MRIQPLQAIVAMHGMKKLQEVIRKRNNNAIYLDKNLKNLYPNVIVPKRIKNYKETFSLYMILVNKRDKLKKYLIDNKIEAKVHYPVPLHRQKAYKNKFSKLDFPISDYQAKHLITIPVHQFLTKKHMNFIIKKINDFYN